MGRVVAEFTMSLDGCIASPDDSVMQLYYWYFSGDTPVTLADGVELRVSAQSAVLLRRRYASVGAVVCGRRWFDLVRGWGGRHPCAVPCFVVSHRSLPAWAGRETAFTPVSMGVEHALAAARAAAGDRDIDVGGANVARQCLQAGLLDELHIHLVPVLLGDGVRLFDGQPDAYHLFGVPSVVEAPDATHLIYRTRGSHNSSV
jgi:dihydrofolate reductase